MLVISTALIPILLVCCMFCSLWWTRTRCWSYQRPSSRSYSFVACSVVMVDSYEVLVISTALIPILLVCCMFCSLWWTRTRCWSYQRPSSRSYSFVACSVRYGGLVRGAGHINGPHPGLTRLLHVLFVRLDSYEVLVISTTLISVLLVCCMFCSLGWTRTRCWSYQRPSSRSSCSSSPSARRCGASSWPWPPWASTWAPSTAWPHSTSYRRSRSELHRSCR